ncbi:F-box domain containing protein [Tanacetum coccineum]|uniref:F-box domain containing protein n=1 Tax=Tanacetum coccineum TaxID=301880 RepID=A0ABQ4XLY9_9ASTR
MLHRSHGGDGGGDERPHHTFYPPVAGACLLLTKTLFDLRPHMDSSRWTKIYEGINMHLQKAYNTNKASFKAKHWKADPTTETYDVDAIRRARPEEYNEEMKRLEATGEYTEDEINALARGGKLRGHIPSVGRVLPSRATSRPSMSAPDKSLKSMHRKVDFMMSLFRKRLSNYSPRKMFKEFDSGVAIRKVCHRGTNCLAEKRVGPTSSLGIIVGDCIPDEDSPATIPQRHFDGDRFPQRHVAGESPEMLMGKTPIVVKKNALELLGVAHIATCNLNQTLVDTESKLASNGDLVFDPTIYRSQGGLLCLAFTRPDISYAVQHMCLHMHDHRDLHFSALKCSTSSYCVFLEDNILPWSSKTKHIVRALRLSTEECNLLHELHTPLLCITIVYRDYTLLMVVRSVVTVDHVVAVEDDVVVFEVAAAGYDDSQI